MKLNSWFAGLVILGTHFNIFAQQDSIPLYSATDTLQQTGNVKSIPDPIYRLHLSLELPLVALGTGWSFYAFTKIYSKEPSTEQEILNLDVNDIPKFDRWAAGFTNETADQNSDLFFYSSLAVPLLLFADKKIRHDAAKISFMYLEAMAITGSIYTGAVYLVDRHRPETYNTTLSVQERTVGNNKDSFIAGHPALVATTMFFTAKVYADYHPESKFKYVLYGLAITATGTTAYLRHIAGKHFPSDLLLGITVGTLSGILVPQFHKTRKTKEPNLGFMPFSNGTLHGLAITYKLK
jgi:membrane-associated phospholipid phosphatase